MQAQTHVVWPLIALGSSADEAELHTSCAYPLIGNALRLCVYCLNSNGAGLAVTAQLQVSDDDGLSWADIGSGVGQDVLGSSSESVMAQNVGQWRVELRMARPNQDWVGRIEVVETEQ